MCKCASNCGLTFFKVNYIDDPLLISLGYETDLVYKLLHFLIAFVNEI